MISALLSLALAAPLDNFVVSDDIGPNKIPHLGTSHILVVPFVTDPSFNPDMDDLRAIYSEDGWFREHWVVESNGLYDPIPTLVDPVVVDCPFPEAAPGCVIDPTNFQLLFGDALQVVFEDALRRIRDEQGVDLAHFDVNGIDGQPDGYFDGVIVHTNLASGVAFPLVSFNQEATIGVRGDDDENTLTVGMPALAPPSLHEFAHTFGFIDHYGGPGPDSLMSQGRSDHFSAYNRSLLGWSDVFVPTQSIEMTLAPTTSGGRLVKIGDGDQFVMLENRDGAIVVTSIDLDALPVGPLGFIDLDAQDLYLPNREEPWLNRLVLEHVDAERDLTQRGDTMVLAHASDGPTGWTVTVVGTTQAGWVRVLLDDGSGAEPIVEVEPEGQELRACGCAQGPSPGLWAPVLLGLLAMRRRGLRQAF